MFLRADRGSGRLPVRGAPRGATQRVFSRPSDTKIEMTGSGTPGGDVCRQFDIDRYLLDGCSDVIALKIADEAVGDRS